jgi:hypothetical protein
MPKQVAYHRDDAGPDSVEAYAALIASLDGAGRKVLANAVAHGAKARLAPDGAVVLSRKDWTEIQIIRAAVQVPRLDSVRDHLRTVTQALKDGDSLAASLALVEVEKWIDALDVRASDEVQRLAARIRVNAEGALRGRADHAHVARSLEMIAEDALAIIAGVPGRRFTGVGHLERTGYIPAGSAAEREGNAGVGAAPKTAARGM